jgi:hypothetical protein
MKNAMYNLYISDSRKYTNSRLGITAGRTAYKKMLSIDDNTMEIIKRLNRYNISLI